MRLRRVSGDCPRRASRGQALVELALVTPLLLLLFAAAADLGRAFYAYVAIENAAKEGALFGSRSPICDVRSAGSCENPNNVLWRVQNELSEQGIRNPDGSALVPAISCSGSCSEGDTYEVSLTYPFQLLTPILGAVVGDLDLQATSRAVVLNMAFDPSPGISINKFVSPTGSVDAGAEVIAHCREPDDRDAEGYYRSPCRNSDVPNAFLTLRFETGATIAYRIVVTNIGGQSLSGVTVADSRGSTGCSFASTIPVGGTLPACNYTRTAPAVPGAALSMDYDNTATVDSAQTDAVSSGVRVTVEKPPARLRVLKWVSPFENGRDGDGVPSFGTLSDLTVTYRPAPQVSGGSVWFKVIVTNTGGQPATGLAVTDSLAGQLPASATCPTLPTTLNAGASWECRYSVAFDSGSPATRQNVAGATASNVTPDGDDTASATLRVQACTGATNRTVPNLIGLSKAAAQTAWSAAGFNNGTLTVWNSNNASLRVVTQSRPAFECVAASSTMTVTQDPTP